MRQQIRFGRLWERAESRRGDDAENMVVHGGQQHVEVSNTMRVATREGQKCIEGGNTGRTATTQEGQ